jgi:predicted permease
MGLAADFLAILGVPCLLAVGLGLIPMPRLARITLIAALPAALLWYLVGPSHSLDEIGLAPISFIVTLGWFLGFWLAGTVRRRRRFANPS